MLDSGTVGVSVNLIGATEHIVRTSISLARGLRENQKHVGVVLLLCLFAFLKFDLHTRTDE